MGIIYSSNHKANVAVGNDENEYVIIMNKNENNYDEPVINFYNYPPCDDIKPIPFDDDIKSISDEVSVKDSNYPSCDDIKPISDEVSIKDYCDDIKPTNDEVSYDIINPLNDIKKKKKKKTRKNKK